MKQGIYSTAEGDQQSAPLFSISSPVIYVVTAGEHSSYGILDVFSTREKAQSYADAYNAKRTHWMAEIEEYPLDPEPMHRGPHGQPQPEPRK